MNLALVFSLAASIRICSSQVSLNPRGQYVTVPGGEAVFRCSTEAVNTRITSVQWIVNNTLLSNRRDLTNHVTTEFSPIGNGVGALRFFDIPIAYNTTRIRCSTVAATGIISESISSTLVLLQGLLTAAQSINVVMNGSFFIIHWDPPFSLNLTGVDPDITYCVDVLNRTSELMIHSECDIEETEFRYRTPSRIWCDWLTFIVTPVNLAGNGTKDATRFLRLPAGLAIIDVLHKYTRPGVISFTIIMSAPVCNAQLTFTNTETEEITTLENVDISIADNNITFTTESLTANVHYCVIVKAVNVHGPSVSNITISTHDVISIHLDIVEGVIAANYIEGSNASGALFSFLNINNSEIDFMRSVLLAVDRNNNSMPHSLYPGHYRVYVYDIERDGTLHNGVGYPAVIKEFHTSLNSEGEPEPNNVSPFDSCEVYTNNYSIVASCVPFTNSMTVGLQIIVQLCTVRNCKLYVNQSLDLNTPVTVPVERDGEYQVSIFAIREGMGILGSSVQYTGVAIINDTSSVTAATPRGANTTVIIILTVAAVVILALSGVALLLICIICFRCKNKKLRFQE